MLLIAVSGCGKKSVQVEVEVPADAASRQIVNIDVRPLAERLATTALMVTDANGNALPSQITSDSLLLFLAELEPGTNTFTVAPGAVNAQTLTTGRIHEDRLDDLAWENDLGGYRAYGPALQRTGEKGYGYDIFTKRDTDQPVLEELYALEHDPNWWNTMNELRANGDSLAADSVFRKHSYHMDHGNGMDCFAVGPTLGAGVTALVDANGDIAYPWCWAECNIVDNGPLRFRAILRFNPTVVDGDTITEVRDITLDAGDYFNKTVVRYEGATAPHTIVAGVPLRDDAPWRADAGGHYLTYENPTLQATPEYNEDQGIILQGIVFAEKADSIATRIDGDKTHVVGYNTLHPGQEYEYYWGFGWTHAGVTPEDWAQIVQQRAARAQQPLKATTK